MCTYLCASMPSHMRDTGAWGHPMICPIFTGRYPWHLPKRLQWKEKVAGLSGQLQQEPFELILALAWTHTRSHIWKCRGARAHIYTPTRVQVNNTYISKLTRGSPGTWAGLSPRALFSDSSREEQCKQCHLFHPPTLNVQTSLLWLLWMGRAVIVGHKQMNIFINVTSWDTYYIKYN